MDSKEKVKGKDSKWQEVGRLQGLEEFTDLSPEFAMNATWIEWPLTSLSH